MKHLLAPVLALALLAPAGRAEPAPDALSVYAIPAPNGMRWSHPRALALRTFANQLGWEHPLHKNSIGHVFVHLESPSLGREAMTGMTSRGPREDRDLILLDGYGLGVLGADMMGRLETPAELAAALADRSRTGLIARMRFLVRPEASARMFEFLDGFKARGLDDHYGGANRPRYGEGGGCSAFGLAFMELAGLMRPAYDAWKVEFRVPLTLYGGPLTGLRASIRRVLLEGRRWARPDEPHVASMFWDPTLMYRWIVDTYDAERRRPSGAWALETVAAMKGLFADARGVPVPAEPIWLEDPAGTPHPYGRQESVRREPLPPPAVPVP